MKNYITLDGGTTNTRLSLVRDGKVTATVKYPVGARASIDGKEPLFSAIREGIDRLLDEAGLVPSDIERVIASGMITCEHGLLELPHTVAPAGIDELRAGMAEQIFPDVSPIPFAFIRGVKTRGELRQTDMMRGEETELMGIIGDDPEGSYLLPGSHSKLVRVDKDGRITDFQTMLTGEMIHALTSATILKDAVDLTAELDLDSLLSGYRTAEQMGVNSALFKVRIMKNLFGATSDQVYSFFLGVVLSDELSEVIASKPARVVIGGKRQLRVASAAILERYLSCPIIALTDEQVEGSVALGAVKVYEHG